MRAELPFKKTSVTSIDHVEAGKRIREARLKSGESLRWLARKMDMSAGFLSDLERGRRNWTAINFEKALKELS